MGKDYVHQVGDLKFVRKEYCGPGNMLQYTLFGSASPVDLDPLKPVFTGVLRLPLKVDQWSPGLDEYAFKAYRHLAEEMRMDNETGHSFLSRDPDSFLTIMKGKLPPYNLNNYFETELKTGNLELRVNKMGMDSNYKSHENLLNQYDYIADMKKNKVWERYFYNTKPGENSENWFLATALSPMFPGALGGFLSVEAIGHADVAIGGLFAGLIGGVGFGLGVTALSGAIRKALFYRNVIRYPMRHISKIHETILRKNVEIAELEKEEKIKKLKLDEKQKSKEDIKQRNLSIENYAQKMAFLQAEIKCLNSELTTLENRKNERTNSIKRLYFAAGKIFDKESYKPGLVVKFTSSELKNVEAFFEPLVKEVSHTSMIINEAYERAGKNVAKVEESLEKVRMIEKKLVTVYQPRPFGEYILLEELGSGGIGKAHKAEDPDGNIVTIKVPLTSDAEKHFRKPQKTIEAITQLEHPNIVKTYHVNAAEKPYEIREYVDGEDLEAKLSKGLLPTIEALKILRETASGLAYAHEKGLVHGDIKPKNILVAKDGTPKIVDFDSARMLDPEEIKLSMSLTKSVGNIVGTWDYMAPEVLRETQRPTKASDVYSFGALMFRVLAGIPKNDANAPLETYRPDIAFGSFLKIVKKCLEPKPQDRYQSMNKVAEGLGAEISRPEKVFEVLKTIVNKDESKNAQETVVNTGKTKEIAEPQIVNGTVVNRGKVSEKFKIDSVKAIPIQIEKREVQLEE